MVDLNDMKELKIVVEQLISDDEMLNLAIKLANKQDNMYIHNLGNRTLYSSSIDENQLKEAKAARYTLDLLHAISLYKENENDVTFTKNNSMYPSSIESPQGMSIFNE